MAWGACWWAFCECGIFGDIMGVAALALMLRVIEVCWESGGVNDHVGLCVCTLLFL